MINWQFVGAELARLLITLGLGALLFRKFVAPGLNEAVSTILEADMKITNLAKLAGVKSNEYKDAKGIEKVVAADLISQNLPELEALKMILSSDTWEKIEDTIAENPEAVLQLWQKYGHLMGGNAAQKKLETDF